MKHLGRLVRFTYNTHEARLKLARIPPYSLIALVLITSCALSAAA